MPTAIDGKAPATTHNTRDNFRPDAREPAFGPVASGDGRMMGYGPVPGPDDLTARFGFDVRDRLLEYSGDGGGETEMTFT